MTKKEITANYDESWKEALNEYFDSFLSFFFPVAYNPHSAPQLSQREITDKKQGKKNKNRHLKPKKTFKQP